MTTVTAIEAEAKFDNLLGRVAKGEEFLITKGNRAIARLVPETKKPKAEARRAARELLQLRERIAKRHKGNADLSYAEVRSALEEGRR